jgi:hypothetical protein
MEINRTGPRNAQFDNTTQKAQPSGARFKSSVSSSGRAQATDGPDADSLGVTQADLADPRKTEETLRRCFSGLVDDSGRQLGISASNSQKSDLVAFLGNDPLMRGKLLNYLDQVVK